MPKSHLSLISAGPRLHRACISGLKEALAYTARRRDVQGLCVVITHADKSSRTITAGTLDGDEPLVYWTCRTAILGAAG